jgi:hypothetical protein
MDQQSEIIALAIVTTVVTNICLYFFRGLGSLALKVYREDFSRTKFAILKAVRRRVCQG